MKIGLGEAGVVAAGVAEGAAAFLEMEGSRASRCRLQRVQLVFVCGYLYNSNSCLAQSGCVLGWWMWPVEVT
jgi:hypothetical protein